MSDCIARQPIFNKTLNIYGYELLHRQDEEANVFSGEDGNTASSETIINSFHRIGIEKITGGRRAFVNFTENLLLDRVVTILPNNMLVVELLENIMPTAEVMEACHFLKSKGYALALDDFVLQPRFKPLIEIADIIKIDFLATPMEQIEEFAHNFKQRGTILLAEKLEDQKSFDKALDMGFKLFQGYFFCKPVTIKAKKNLSPSKLVCLDLMRMVFDPYVDFKKLASTIKRDVSLSYQLLKVVNSAFFGLKSDVSNLQQALALLGMNEIKKWVTLISLAEIRDNRPRELIRMALSRARFLELIAAYVNLKSVSEDLYITGMLSLMDTLMDAPATEIITEINISPDIAAAILSNSGVYGELLAIVLHYEKGGWEEAFAAGAKFGLSAEQITQTYIQSLEWANKF
jgi:EAL and modified HD-GYP domain-containing signal transduction protein